MTDPDTGKVVEDYVIDNHEDYRFMMGRCQTRGIEGFEVAAEFFKQLLPVGSPPSPYLITGTPAVRVYPQGTMERTKQIELLTVDDINELRANKARRLASEKEDHREKLKKEIKEL